jgi:uncharacterized membrane protein YfcA
MLGIDWVIAGAGLAVGAVVGLTGMGGGALMTPILVLLFGIPPTVAVASDLAASLFMKPVGALMHMRRGTVNGPLVRYLVLGSVPSAFAGAALINHIGRSAGVDGVIKSLLGGALLVAATATVLKATLGGRRSGPPGSSDVPIGVKPVPTFIVGILGGFIVGMTSVGSGSLVIVMLMLLYPRLSGSRLVGTDLAQAIPLVGAAALGHFVFGHVHLHLTASLLAGSIPGVAIGAHFSARSADRFIRPVLVVVLVASALKLLGASNPVVGVVSALLAAGGTALAFTRRNDAAEPALATEPVAATTNASSAET